MSIYAALSSSLSLPSQLLLHNPPPTGTSQYCDQALHVHQPLKAILAFVWFYGVNFKLVGEDGNIMRFVELERPDGAPPSFTTRLWLAGYAGSHHIRIHTPAETMQYQVVNRHQVAHIAEFIRDFLRRNDIKGSLRPKPLTDAHLLDLLSTHLTSPRHGYFAEGMLAIHHNFPLDACAHILMPFGLQPILSDKPTMVTFQEVGFNAGSESRREAGDDPNDVDRGFQLAARSNIMAGVCIERAPALKCCPGTGVLLHGPHTGFPGQEERDNRRRLGFLALSTGEVTDIASFQGMFFNLADAQDRLCFVRRVLAMRDEVRNIKEAHINRAQYHVRYTKPSRYMPNEYSLMLLRRLDYLRLRTTPLSAVLSVEEELVLPQPVVDLAPVEYSKRHREWLAYLQFRKRGRGGIGLNLMRALHRRWKRWYEQHQLLELERQSAEAQHRLDVQRDSAEVQHQVDVQRRLELQQRQLELQRRQLELEQHRLAGLEHGNRSAQ
jgi:hypothetical protein